LGSGESTVLKTEQLVLDALMVYCANFDRFTSNGTNTHIGVQNWAN